MATQRLRAFVAVITVTRVIQTITVGRTQVPLITVMNVLDTVAAFREEESCSASATEKLNLKL